MNYLIWTHVAYGLAAVALTAVLARTLFRHGALFLESVFEDNARMANAVNRLLVTGFYMLNMGYALLIFRTNDEVEAVAITENLISRLGLLLVSLGVIHFVNMAVFFRIRRGGERAQFTPARPTTTMTPPPPRAGVNQAPQTQTW